MEMAAKVRTELALSGLFRVVGILDENFRDVKTIEEMKPLNDLVDYKIETLTREAKSDDLVQLMSSLEELQVAALELENLLDLYEYEQIEKRVNSSSSEPIPKEQVLPGLNKLLMIVERVENKRQSITTSNSFIDFLVGESRVARPVIKLAISDISRVIKMLGSNFESRIHYPEILEQLKDVVSYHIQALIRNVNSNDLARSTQLLEMLKAASLQLDLFDPREFGCTQKQGLFDPDEYDYTQKQVSSSNSVSLEKFKPKLKEVLRPILPKSPLRIGLENMLKVVEQVEKKHPSITSSTTGTTQPQTNIFTPTLSFGVEKWLKFVEQVEKEHPFITSKKSTTHPRPYTITPISTAFFPGLGFLKTTSLENVECQEDVEVIMRNHKNLKTLIFEWIDSASNIGTCEKVLERLEPDQSLENLKIGGYQGGFPNWMVKENWLPRLQTLELWSCISFKIVPFLPPRLQKLVVLSCNELMQLPPLSDTLRFLCLYDCPKLQALTNLSPTMTNLSIANCPKLTLPSKFNKSSGLSDLSFLINLKILELGGFPNLQALTNLSPTVTRLSFVGCPMLTSLGNLQCCTSLEFLSIFKCPMLLREEASVVEGVVEGDIANRLPQVEHIETDEPLLVLELVQQQALSSIQSLRLRGLQRPFLHMSDEYFHHFPSLVGLTLLHCEALPNLEKLSSLLTLDICNCPKVELLPNLPVSLQSLGIKRCPKLKEKYEEGAPLRNIISHIPKVVIY